MLQIMGRYFAILLVLAASMGAGAAVAQDPRTGNATVKYMRYKDPAVDPDVFKVLEVALVSAGNEVKAEGCKSGPNKTLQRAKLVDAGDTRCPDGRNPNLVVVIPGMIEKVDGTEVVVSYEVTGGAAGLKKTITLPKDLIAKKDKVEAGSEIIFFPTGLGSTDSIVKDFKAFEKEITAVPPKAMGKIMVGIQMK